MRKTVGTLLGKSVARAVAVRGKSGGQAMPGLVVESLIPGYLASMLRQLPEGVVVITGTNGKTTTTKMVVELMQAGGKRVLTNPTGSNLTRGIISSVSQQATKRGKLPFDIAVFELDEAYARQFTKVVTPRWVLGLNASRDQLDRFGEVDHVARLISETMLAASEGIVTNADDKRLSKAAAAANVPVTYFGVAPDLLKHFPRDDELVAINRPTPHLMAQDVPLKVELQAFQNDVAQYRIDQSICDIQLQITDSTQRPRRKGNNTFTTKSGKTIKVNRNLGERMRASREAKAQRKAAYLSTLPKEPWKRLLYRMHPKRLYKYWFSREGGIMALKIAGISFVAIFLIVVGLFAYFRKDLPKIHDLSGNDFGGSITYYDRTGKVVLFQDYDAVKRVPVDGKDISTYMKQATVAVEDKDFYHEGAFNVKGITRAALNNAKGGSTQGGSTITQQLVKLNEGWTSDRTISRKVKELILAVELEREYSKDDILNAYLNMAPYGNVDYGVQSAAQDYFHVDASKLSLAQAAMLASIPKAPGSLSPFSDPKYNDSLTASFFDQESLIARQHYVLDQMAEQKYITKAQAEEAKKVDIIAQVQKLQSHYAGIKAPYFVLAAKQQLLREFPASVVKTGGWKVTTSLDMNLQTLAESSLEKGLPQLRRQNADNAAFVAEDNSTGEVVALIGGTDFNNKDYGKLNFATDIDISPGSSFKPYDYSAFINNNTNVGAGSVLYDQIGALPSYPCTNRITPEQDPDKADCLWDFDRQSPGPTTLRYALGGSRNIPAAKAMLSAVPNDNSKLKTNSINKVISTANDLMYKKDAYRCYQPGTDVNNATKANETQCYTASAIGDGAYVRLSDHVNGISSIARMGKAIPQTFILKVVNASGKNIPLPSADLKPKQVLKPDTAYIVSDMAADPKASYLSGNCSDTTCSGMKFHRYKGWHTAIKTGTTNDLADGLMLSWNTKYTAGIWVGNHEHNKNHPYTGQPEYMTDPIMKSFMQGAIDQLGPTTTAQQTWTKPSDIKTASAYVVTRRYAGQSVPSATTDLYPSWYVGKTSNSSATTDKVSGKLATSCTPPLARQTSYNRNTSVWNVDIFMNGNPSTTANTGTSAQGSDDVHNCGDVAPTVTITAVNGKSVNGDASCPATGSCTVQVHVEQGTHPLTDSQYADYPGTITLSSNGQTLQTQQVNNTGDYTLTFNVPDGTAGSLQLQAQVTDSVLYQSTDTRTVTIKTAKLPTNSGPGAGNGNGPGGNGNSRNRLANTVTP